jgi:transcriptional regulator with XRE-family HTH domain
MFTFVNHSDTMITVHSMKSASNKLGRAITRYRRAAGLSMSECARKAGVSKSLLLYWEEGTRTPKAPNLQRLARALGVDFEDLFELAGYATPGHLPELPVYLRQKERLNQGEAERVARYVARIKQQGGGRAKRDR